jgi:hypothetical protein
MKVSKRRSPKNIITYIPDNKLEKNWVLTKQEIMGWFSIVAIYLAVGVDASSLLGLPNNVLAWLVCNVISVTWLFGVESNLAGWQAITVGYWAYF